MSSDPRWPRVSVRAHVFLCMLAHYVADELQQRLAPLAVGVWRLTAAGGRGLRGSLAVAAAERFAGERRELSAVVLASRNRSGELSAGCGCDEAGGSCVRGRDGAPEGPRPHTPPVAEVRAAHNHQTASRQKAGRQAQRLPTKSNRR